MVDVHYFDSVNGGAGMLRMKLEHVPSWLDANPGFLIRKIRPA